MTARIAGIVLVAGVLGWVGLIWLATTMYATHPPRAGFDLELLVRAGRDVAAGRSPYDPAMLAGTAPVAERLFYSYPPIVAQLMAFVAWLPSPVMFAGWAAAAVAAFGWVAGILTARIGGSGAVDAKPATVGLVMIAVTPLLFPFAIGLLFGNLDVFFPLLYGLVLLGVLPRASGVDRPGAGVAATTAAVTKLHPGSLGLWLILRSAVEPRVRRAVVAAIAVLVGALAVSVAIGGVQPWLDYAAVVRAGSGADLVDPRNAGPAAQLAMLLQPDAASAESLARTLQIPVTLLALAATAIAALRFIDPVESLAWAAAASLVVLPVTWYHYPSALIPFALVALLRAGAAAGRRVRILVAGAALVAAIAIAILPLLYVATGLVLAAVRSSRPASIASREPPTLPAGASA